MHFRFINYDTKLGSERFPGAAAPTMSAMTLRTIPLNNPIGQHIYPSAHYRYPQARQIDVCYTAIISKNLILWGSKRAVECQAMGLCMHCN